MYAHNAFLKISVSLYLCVEKMDQNLRPLIQFFFFFSEAKRFLIFSSTQIA